MSDVGGVDGGGGVNGGSGIGRMSRIGRIGRIAWTLTAVAVGAVLLAACGSSGSGSSTGTTHPKNRTTTTAVSRSTTTTTASSSSTSSTTSGPTVTATLPVVVCQTNSAIPTTTTSLPASVQVKVPPSEASQGNLAVFSDLQGSLMLVGPTVGWTCSGSFGADGSGLMALAPVGTMVPQAGTTWHPGASSTVQAIVAVESGASTVTGAQLVCPLFTAAKAAVRQNLGTSCAASPSQETATPISSVAVGFQDPPGVAGIGFPSGGQNPASGVGLYKPESNEPTAYLATCTLPAAQQNLCAAVLNQFVANFG